MELSIAADRSRPRAAVVNENVVRAAAGVTMVIGAVAFAYAYFAKQYVPLQVAASLFFADFLTRVTAGLRYSPIGIVARAITLGRPPEWVSAKPKRFAWRLGLVMSLAMTVITNSGIRGPLPRTMCLVCLTLMWMESALGLCVGCRIYGLLVRRDWIGTDPAIEVCADGSCQHSSELTNKAATRVPPPVQRDQRGAGGRRAARVRLDSGAGSNRAAAPAPVDEQDRAERWTGPGRHPHGELDRAPASPAAATAAAAPARFTNLCTSQSALLANDATPGTAMVCGPRGPVQAQRPWVSSGLLIERHVEYR